MIPGSDSGNYPDDFQTTPAADCPGYAVSRAFEKTWDMSDLHSAAFCNLNREVPSNYFEDVNGGSFTSESQFISSISAGDVVGWIGTHFVFVTGKTGNTLGQIKVKEVPFVNQYVRESNMYEVTKYRSNWLLDVHISRVLPKWNIKFTTNLPNKAGRIHIDFSEKTVPYTPPEKFWGKDYIIASDVMDATTRDGYYLEWNDWTGDDNTYNTSSKSINKKLSHYSTDYEITANYNQYSEVTVKNYLSGHGNVGTITINSDEKTLPLLDPELVKRPNPIVLKAKSSFTYNRIVYIFDHWSTGSTSQQIIYTPQGATTITAYFKGHPMEVTGEHNASSIGQNIKIAWDEHPDPNVYYRIWRHRKNVQNSHDTLTTNCGPVSHGTTVWTDPLFTRTSSYSNYLLTYAVVPYFNLDETTGTISFTTSVLGRIDFWNVKSDSAEATIFDEQEDSQDRNKLSIGPNPFNPSTVIHFSLNSTQHIQITIYDLNGRMLEKLVDTELPAGNGQVTWNATNYASGTYLLLFKSNEKTEVKRLVLLK